MSLLIYMPYKILLFLCALLSSFLLNTDQLAMTVKDIRKHEFFFEQKKNVCAITACS